MKRSKFTEEQIIAILREQGQRIRRRREDGRGLSQAREQRCFVSCLEGEVWPHGAVRSEAAEDARACRGHSDSDSLEVSTVIPCV